MVGGKIKKVYCEDCRYYDRAALSDGRCPQHECTKNKRTEYFETPMNKHNSRIVGIEYCEGKNKNFNCSDFEKKKVGFFI